MGWEGGGGGGEGRGGEGGGRGRGGGEGHLQGAWRVGVESRGRRGVSAGGSDLVGRGYLPITDQAGSDGSSKSREVGGMGGW